MTIPFGPQLIGEAEKTVSALLRRFLAEPRLTEAQWVTLRVAQLYGAGDAGALAARVSDRAHFDDATELVRGLTARGLLESGQLTSEGREVISGVLAASERVTGGVWRDLPTDDVEATTRVLNEIVARAHALLA